MLRSLVREKLYYCLPAKSLMFNPVAFSVISIHYDISLARRYFERVCMNIERFLTQH